MALKETIEFIHINLEAILRWRFDVKEYNHLDKLLKNAKRENTLKKTIVFNTVRNLKSINDREFFLGKLLALKGAKVFLLLDDGMLKHWDTYTLDFFVSSIRDISQMKSFKLNPYQIIPSQIQYNKLRYWLVKYFNRKRFKKGLNTYKDKNLQVLYYSQILKNINHNNWQDLKKFVDSSTIRFFKTSILDYKNKYVKFYHNLSYLNAVLSRSVGEHVVNKLKADLFITSHGIYSTWGPAYEFVKKNRIKCIVYASAHAHSYKHDEFFCSNTIIQLLTRSKFWQNYKKKPITEIMRQKVEYYFKKRQNFDTKDAKFLFKGKINYFSVEKNDGYKYHIALFPNVIWDGNITAKHLAFKGYFDWIKSTINYLKNNKDIKVYIKSHPSEITVLKDSPRIVDIIKSQINLNQINNIVLIPPEMKIDTYKFLKSGIDLGIVYDGFLAVEIPYMKIPTIMCVDRGYFSVEGGNYIVKSKKEYFQYLDNIDETIRNFHNRYDKIRENIIRYLYWYIFEIGVKLPTLSKTTYLGTDLKQLKKEDLKLDEKFLRIIQN